MQLVLFAGGFVFQEFAAGARPPGGPLVSGGSRQHQKEDLSLRLSGERSAEGRQGNDMFIEFCPTLWFLLLVFILCFNFTRMS